MTESIKITKSTKKEKYQELFPQISSLISGEKDLIANMANIASVLKYSFDFFWVGFYTVKGRELVLSPFQGKIACTRIPFGAGVCGSAWQKAETIIVPDVEKFKGHIACSSESKSEIVVPLLRDRKVEAVLDIDSDKLNSFDDIDKEYLEKIAALL
jgi:GAF domain-containing protein